jgi:hypothetical protein
MPLAAPRPPAPAGRWKNPFAARRSAVATVRGVMRCRGWHGIGGAAVAGDRADRAA